MYTVCFGVLFSFGWANQDYLQINQQWFFLVHWKIVNRANLNWIYKKKPSLDYSSLRTGFDYSKSRWITNSKAIFENKRIFLGSLLILTCKIRVLCVVDHSIHSRAVDVAAVAALSLLLFFSLAKIHTYTVKKYRTASCYATLRCVFFSVCSFTVR